MKKFSPPKVLSAGHWWWVAVLVVAGLLRFWQISAIPSTLNRDEAALAYNAFLLEQTGKDEWQQTWPLALKSFGDYKLPGYVWGVIGSFKFFGYTDAAVKFPSAVAGTVLPILVYLLLRRVAGWGKQTSVLAALITATLPVLVFYSRIGFEANLALSLLIACIVLLFDKAPRWPIAQTLLGLVFLALAVLTYNTPLLLLPVLFVLAVVHLRCPETLAKVRVLGLVGMLTIGISGGILLKSVSSQKQSITLFGDEATILATNAWHDRFSGPAQRLVGSKYLFWSGLVAQKYLATLSPSFLVTKGGTHPWHQLPGFAHLSWSVYVLSLIGASFGFWQAAKLWKKGKLFSNKDAVTLLLILTLAAPLPAAITVDAPHATRSLLFFVLLAIWAAYGAQQMYRFLQKRSSRFATFFQGFVVAAMMIEAALYSQQYFKNYPAESQFILQGGYDLQVQQLAGSDAFQSVAVVDPGGFQYILTAWYLKMPPTAFFATITHHLPDRIGFQYGYKVGQFRFIARKEDQLPTEQKRIEWNEGMQQWQTVTQ